MVVFFNLPLEDSIDEWMAANIYKQQQPGVTFDASKRRKRYDMQDIIATMMLKHIGSIANNYTFQVFARSDETFYKLLFFTIGFTSLYIVQTYIL